MTCWAVIPVKAPSDSKRRLAEMLDARAREGLVAAMLEHVLGACKTARNIDRTCVIGPASDQIKAGVALLADPGGGLNAALRSALTELGRKGVDRLLIVPADLPQVTARDLELLAVPPAGTVAIAPDRHGTGTNAISLPLPEAADFVFAFGTDSFALHHAEAERLGLKVEVIHSHGLARDIDVPEDLPDAAGLLRPPG